MSKLWTLLRKENRVNAYADYVLIAPLTDWLNDHMTDWPTDRPTD